MKEYSLHLLYENDSFYVGHEYENAYLVNKLNGEQIFIDDFYGEPTCALISHQHDWCLVGGEKLILWTKKETQTVGENILNWIYDMRFKDDTTVEILTDPWTEFSAVWKFNITTGDLTRIRNFTDYLNKEYTESVNW